MEGLGRGKMEIKRTLLGNAQGYTANTYNLTSFYTCIYEVKLPVLDVLGVLG